MIRNEEISVVIQGPYFADDNWTKRSCESVRKILPGAEIIFSTWKGCDVHGVDYDKLVENEDPGVDGEKKTNLKRQVVSTYNGIRACSRKYVLKIRSESVLKERYFVEEFERWDKHGKAYHFLKERLVVINTKPSRRKIDMFHIVDWYFFGLKEDMLCFWDIDMIRDISKLMKETTIVCNEHRFFFLHFVNQFMPINYYEIKDATRSLQRIHNEIVAENFVVTETVQRFGAESLKYPPGALSAFDMNMRCNYRGYTKKEWIHLYNKYCGGDEKSRRTIYELFVMYVLAPIYMTYKYAGGIHLYARIRRRIRYTKAGERIATLWRKKHERKKTN